MAVSASEVILEYVCPALGVLMANIMFAAPVRDCSNAVVAGRGLQSLNPTPWAFMLGNTFGWVTYGILIQNLFVFFGNAPGFVISAWLNLQAVKMQYESFRSQAMKKSVIAALDANDVEDTRLRQEKDKAGDQHLEQTDAPAQDETEQTRTTSSLTDTARIVWAVTAQKMIAPAAHDILVLANVLVWMAIVAIISFATAFSDRTSELIVGVTVNLNLVVFYASPLSVIWTVLRTRSAATIHIPTMLTNTANGAFWAAYGIAVLDPFIIVPNSLGAALGVVQIVLCVLFPRGSADARDELDAENPTQTCAATPMINSVPENDAATNE